MLRSFALLLVFSTSGCAEPVVGCPPHPEALDDNSCQLCPALADAPSNKPCQVIGCSCRRELGYGFPEDAKCVRAPRPTGAACDQDGAYGCDDSGACTRGRELWRSTVATLDGNIAGTSIQADGRIVLAGSFADRMTLPNQSLASQGDHDLFVLSLDATGGLQWVRTFGDSSEQRITALALRPDGSIVVAGSFKGALTLSDSVELVSTSASSPFVAVLSGEGAPLWARAIDHIGESIAEIAGVGADASGAIALGGTFDGELTIGTASVTAPSPTDIFVARFAADGALTGVSSYRGAYADKLTSFAVAPDGASLLAGWVSHEPTFGSAPVSGSKVEGSTGGIVLAKLDPQGIAYWAQRLEVDTEGAMAIARYSPNGGSLTAINLDPSMRLLEHGPDGTLLRETAPSEASLGSVFAEDAQGRIALTGIGSYLPGSERNGFAALLDASRAPLFAATFGPLRLPWTLDFDDIGAQAAFTPEGNLVVTTALESEDSASRELIVLALDTLP